VKNILVYVSSATAVPYREGGKHQVGVFLGELTEPLEPLIKAGHHLTFMSPDGQPPHIDKNSYRLLYWGFNRRRIHKADQVKIKLDKLGMSQPLKAADVIASGLDKYDVLFIPGGHAPMTDILYKDWLTGTEINSETGVILKHFHTSQKITALICHAPSVLAAAPQLDGKWIYDGYKMTCVTMLAEFLIEDIPPFKVMKGHLPDYPAHILHRHGAILRNKWIPMLSNVVEDRELITGQDPYSAELLGIKLLEKINRS
jgi:putative intracellular protease/amidase